MKEQHRRTAEIKISNPYPDTSKTTAYTDVFFK